MNRVVHSFIPAACCWVLSLNFLYSFWVVVGRPEVLIYWWVWVIMAVVFALQLESLRKDLISAWAEGGFGFNVKLVAGVIGATSALFWEKGRLIALQLASDGEWPAFGIAIFSVPVLGFNLAYAASTLSCETVGEAFRSKDGRWWRLAAFIGGIGIVAPPVWQLLVAENTRMTSMEKCFFCLLTLIVSRLLFEVFVFPYRLFWIYRIRKDALLHRPSEETAAPN